MIDDLQWAEPAVFEILEGLADRAEDAPLLLVCVARPQLLESHPAWAAGRANAATITLDALSGEETTTLISRLLDVDDLPAELRARVVQRSEGNPLFCEDFLRMLIDEGRVERVDDRWRATASAADVRVPESIHALLAARLDGLADEERRAIQVASIVGERFGGPELRALAPDLDVSRALGGLRRSGLVLEDRETREPERYRFKHLLMRDVAYAGLPKAARADLHEAFAAQFERAVGDRRDEFAEILAHHAERAFTLSTEVRAPRAVIEPRARRVLDWALALGERARRRQDRGLLAPYAATAAAALAALGDGASAEDRIGVALLSANERRVASAYAEAIAGFEDAARLAAKVGRPHLEAQAHLGAAAVVVWSAAEPSEFAAFQKHAAEAERLFRETGDAGGEIEAGIIGLEALWGAGAIAELVERGEALRDRAHAIGDGARELLICARLVPAAVNSGRSDLAAAYQSATDELVARLGAREPPWSRTARCGRIKFTGDLVAAERCYQGIREVAGTERDPLLLVAGLRNGAEILLEEHRYAEAEPLLEQAIALSARIGERWNRTELTGSLAVAIAGRGDLDRAERVLLDARALARPADIFAVARVAHSAALVRELEKRWDEADAEFRTTLQIFAPTGFGASVWDALVRLDYAAFLARAGRAAEAAEHLAAADAQLGPQIGARGARIAALREGVSARPG